MIHLKVSFVGGNFILTGFNGTEAEARAYYAIGRSFNVGRGEHDFFETVAAVEVISE